MPPKKKSTRTTRQNISVDTRKLEMLIRDTVRSEMIARQTHKQTIENYSQKIHNIDGKVTEFIQQAITENTRAYRLTIDSFFIGYLAAIFILVAGLAMTVTTINNDKLFTIAVSLVAIGGIWIINLQNRNLSKSNRSLVNNLAKLNIIFAGYIRQIQLLDTVFDQLAGNSEGITILTAEQLLTNLQDAVSEAMTAVSNISNELDE